MKKKLISIMSAIVITAMPIMAMTSNAVNEDENGAGFFVTVDSSGMANNNGSTTSLIPENFTIINSNLIENVDLSNIVKEDTPDIVYISDKPNGDANGDGKVNISDLVILQKYLFGMTDSVDLKGADLYVTVRSIFLICAK